ncbi:multi-copper oxidase type 1 family protein [Tripterygium wilfordii]|uniref:Multi-copper oxidase type 1 family protein n=1 Tax=Tripterygium wilfordii TaxID=458696 RepID=A0A7J7CNM9_TRIWF|nr:L-ascorbate oxidase homolog [Tripterygium wilfordii]KAF5735674.1 multi-copper oxidase type 1 family protein [Tripterygium wilfordii]
MDGVILMFLLICLSAGTMSMVRGEDPYIFFTWNITYGTISPLGVPQQVIMINNQFPGPNINSTSNNNVVVNVFNNLDEPFLLTWTGVQQRKNSWQDGVLGTNCPIPPGTNYTYHFQVKDQIGSYMYYPSVGMQRAAGGFGGLRINSRLLIPVPYPDPEDDYTVIINDWYTKSHSALTKFLDSGRSIGRPEGVLINGQAAKGDGKDKPLFTMKPGKTYKYRICNAGIKTSLNFRIQNHNMKLVEMEGSHVVQNVYESLDVHAGQCFSVLVTADQEPKDYYMVASTRFTKTVLTSKGIMSYEGGKGPASPELPEAPVGWAWSLNQFRTFRWNLTASAARPNPQGSYHYGAINITRTIKLVNTVDRSGGKLRYALNGVSHVDVPTPLKLAEYYGITDKVFKYDSIPDEPPANIEKVTVQPNVNNVTFRTFVEIIFENHEKNIQSYHLSGYSFFAVAIEPGTWGPEKRKNYNLLDAISRHTIQVFPKSWAATLLTFDNAGMWNLRSEIWERTYLGQQLYISVLSPERSLRDEYNVPDNSILCGLVKDLPKPPPYSI